MPLRKKPSSLFVKRTYTTPSSSMLRDLPFASSLSGGGKHSKRRKTVMKWLKVAGIVAAFGLVGAILGTAFLFAWVSRDLPDPNKLLTRQIAKSTKIWDRTGTHLLYEIHGAQQRTLVTIDQISPMIKNATISSEDKHFYEHKGVRLQSFVRAIFQGVFTNRRLEGTSTITQQVVKNVILSNERSAIRKAKELILSYQIEKKFTKDEILQIYFNETPYGSTAYGIEAASQMYFGHSAQTLDAAEASLLAAIVPAPTRLSPYGSNQEEVIWRQQRILDVMQAEGYLTQEEVDAAKKVDILAKVRPRRENIEAPHFVIWVKEQLADAYGEREVEQGGFNVTTTLDFDKQKFAEEAVIDGMEAVIKYGGSNAALVAIDPKTGHILAMVGSADYFNDEIDGAVNVVLRGRQPGSSFKPIAYAEALEKGYTPDTVVFDVNTAFPTDSGKAYEPKNYDLAEHGPVTLRKALAGSLNTPAVKALYLAGVDATLDRAEKLGYTTLGDRSRFGLSLVLGGGEVKLLEHAAAFATFASDGTYRPPVSILKVEDSNGEILQEWKEKEHDVEDGLSVQTARNINEMLSDNGQRAYIFGERNFLTLPDRPVAAKTGTTNLFHDAWTMGYTPNIVAGVWTGNNDNRAMKSKADGSRVAAPIWQSFMKKAHEGIPAEDFAKPDPITTGKPVLDGQAGEIRVKVDKFSGKLATEFTPPSAVEERIYRQAHDILHYVVKDDPRGPIPTDPASDPQYAAWEQAVADWAVRNNWTTTEPPPTEVDTRDPQLSPTVNFELPQNAASISERSFLARVGTFSPRGVKRVEYYVDGALAGTSVASPWEAWVNIPSIFNKGFYTLKAVAYDDVDNYGSAEISINILTDGKAITADWIRPSTTVTYRTRVFPVFIDMALSDRLGVSSVDITAEPIEGESILIGTLKNPQTNGVSVTWETAPAVDDYVLNSVIHLVNGETKTLTGPTIKVRE